MKGVVHTIAGVRGKDPRDPAVTLRRCGRQVWAGHLFSCIARERQRSALSGPRSRLPQSIKEMIRSRHPNWRRHARVQCGEASNRPVSDRHFRSGLKRASNDGLRRQGGGQPDDAVRIGPRNQRGDLLVGASGRNAGGFDDAQDANRALQHAPLIHDPGEEVATE